MSRDELKKLSTKELKAQCKELGLTGYSRLKEDELIELILGAQEEPDSEIDELLDGVEDEEESETETESTEESGETTEDEEESETETESTEDEGSLVVFKKLIKGPFGFGGKIYKGSTIELTAKEAAHPKIQNALKCQMIAKK